MYEQCMEQGSSVFEQILREALESSGEFLMQLDEATQRHTLCLLDKAMQGFRLLLEKQRTQWQKGLQELRRELQEERRWGESVRGRCRDLQKLYEEAECRHYDLAEKLDISVGHFNQQQDQLEREKEKKQHLEKSLLHCEGHIELLEQQKQQLADRLELVEALNAQLREELRKTQEEVGELEQRFKGELSLREEKIRELSVKIEDHQHRNSMSSVSRMAARSKQGSVIERDSELNSSDGFHLKLQCTLPQQRQEEREMAVIKLIPRSSLPSERKSAKKSTKAPPTLHKRTGREEVDKNTARRTSTAAQDGLREIFMDRVKYRQEADRIYEAKLSEATSKLKEENERQKREVREAHRNICDMRREMGRLSQQLCDQQEINMQLEDELQRLKNEIKFKNAEIKRLTREYIIKKAESDAFSEELSELEASFAAHLHPSQAMHNQRQEDRSSFSDISQKFDHIARQYASEAVEGDLSFKSAVYEAGEQEETNRKKGYFSIQNSQLEESGIEHRHHPQYEAGSLSHSPFSPERIVRQAQSRIQHNQLNRIADILNGEMQNERMQLSDYLQQTEHRPNSLSEFQIIFSEFHSTKLKIVSQCFLASHAPQLNNQYHPNNVSTQTENTFFVQMGINTEPPKLCEAQTITDPVRITSPLTTQRYTNTLRIQTVDQNCETFQELQLQVETQEIGICTLDMLLPIDSCMQTEDLLCEIEEKYTVDQLTNTESEMARFLQMEEQSTQSQYHSMRHFEIVSIHLHQEIYKRYEEKGRIERVFSQNVIPIFKVSSNKIVSNISEVKIDEFIKEKKVVETMTDDRVEQIEVGFNCDPITCSQFGTTMNVDIACYGVNTISPIYKTTYGDFIQIKPVQITNTECGYEVETAQISIGMQRIELIDASTNCNHEMQLLNTSSMTIESKKQRNYSQSPLFFTNIAKILTHDAEAASEKKILSKFNSSQICIFSKEKQYSIIPLQMVSIQKQKQTLSQENVSNYSKEKLGHENLSESDPSKKDDMSSYQDQLQQIVSEEFLPASLINTKTQIRGISLKVPKMQYEANPSNINSGRTRSSSQQILSHRSQTKSDTVSKVKEQKPIESSPDIIQEVSSASHSRNSSESVFMEENIHCISPNIHISSADSEEKEEGLEEPQTKQPEQNIVNGMLVKSQKQERCYRFDESTVNVSQERDEINHLRVINSFEYRQTSNLEDRKQTLQWGTSMLDSNSLTQQLPALTTEQTRLFYQKFFMIESLQLKEQAKILKDQYTLNTHLYIFSATKDKIQSKFVIWHGRVMHIGKQTEYMQLPLGKQPHVVNTPGTLNLGNSQLTIYNKRLNVYRRGKRNYFRGRCCDGEWRINRVWKFQPRIRQ